MIMIILMIMNLGGFFSVLEQIFVWLAVALTVISLVDYLYKNRNVLSMQG